MWDPEPWEWPCDLELSLDDPLPDVLEVELEPDESLEPDELPESDEFDDVPDEEDEESDVPLEPLEPFEDLAVLEALVLARLSVL